jgi:hypothetical protein
MIRRTAIAVAGAGLLLALGCSPYDPNLGTAPFKCGTSQPLCPRGYICDGDPGFGVCLREGDPDLPDSGPSLPDAPPFSCADDSATEPNDTLQTAFPTPVMEDLPMVSYASLAICPDSDIDHYRININQPNVTLRAEITHASQQGRLALEILNNSGTVIREGTPLGANADVLRADVPQIALGVYYVRVQASGPGIRNNYSLAIQTF